MVTQSLTETEVLNLIRALELNAGAMVAQILDLAENSTFHPGVPIAGLNALVRQLGQEKLKMAERALGRIKKMKPLLVVEGGK